MFYKQSVKNFIAVDDDEIGIDRNGLMRIS